jgi:hypothetical protein
MTIFPGLSLLRTFAALAVKAFLFTTVDTEDHRGDFCSIFSVLSVVKSFTSPRATRNFI